MRLTFELFGHTLDVTLGPSEADEDVDFEPYQDAGTIGSERISGEHNGWEKPANLYDEASEGDEEASRIGFGRRP